jgi:hypothetical protein
MEADDMGPDDFDIAYRDTIKGYAPGVPEIATMTRTSPTVIYNQANINMPKHVPSIKMLRAVMKITKDLRCLDVLAKENGAAIYRLPDLSKVGDTALLEIYTRINIETGDLAKKLFESLQDGSITMDEARGMDLEATQLVAVVLELMARIHAIAK